MAPQRALIERGGPLGLVLLLLAAWSALISSHALAVGADELPVSSPSPSPAPSPAPLTNFLQFKILFHKSYSSILEEVRRQALFLSNLLQAVSSRLRFKSKRASSFRSVNDMSDWTRDEFEATQITLGQYYRGLGVRMLADTEVEGARGSDPDEVQFRRILASALEQQQVEAAGGSQARAQTRRRRRRSVEGALETLGSLDAKVYVASNMAVLRATRAYFNYKPPAHDPSKPDEIFADHRRCLSEPKSQQHCPCCHVFATLGLYEWAYCNSTATRDPSGGAAAAAAAADRQLVRRIEFSPQYVLDCGPQVGVDSSDGGNESEVAKFVERLGLELAGRYKFHGWQAQCAYNQDEESERLSRGYLRLDNAKLVRVSEPQFERQLSVSPLTVAIYVSSDFSQYGGGVDAGHGCTDGGQSSLHAVLLVGSGRQDGHEYWLIRNSHGDHWGERGYYKLRKDSNCLADFGNGYTLKGLKFNANNKEAARGFHFTLNPHYDWHLLSERFRKHALGPPELPEYELVDGA